MDRDNRRRGSAAVQMAHPQLRPSLYHSNASSPSRQVASRHRPSYTSDSTYDSTQSPSRSRVNGRAGTNTPPPRLNADVTRFSREHSPLTTGLPGTPSRRDSKSSDAGASSLVNPTSVLLQGLIKEQRATRGSSRRAVSEVVGDAAAVTPPSTQSQEDTPSEKQRKVNSALSAGLRQPREMGVREMDQYVSKINKLNFDLKLEVFHRAQQVAALEKKLVRMRGMEEELERMHDLEDELEELRDVEENNQRLRESNEQLRSELDKRDHAVTEAVELICQLEAKMEEMEAERLDSRPSTARPHTGDSLNEDEPLVPEVSTPKAQLAVDIPDRTSSKRGTRYRQARADVRDSSRPKKAPSFLRENNKSTTVLRSLYMGDDTRTRGAPSVLTKSESWQSSYEATEPDSPRLSALSECSYLSPEAGSSTKQDGFDELDIAARPAAANISISETFRSAGEDVESKIARIDRWIPPRPDHFRAPAPKGRDRASSDVSRRTQLLGSENAPEAKYVSKPHNVDASHLGVTVFGNGRLPPTPDTMSTSYPGVRNGSNGSIVAEKSRVDQAPLYMRRKLGRPCSAGDITTRPSTAVTGISDSMETALSDATQQGLTIRAQHEYPSMLPFLGRGSSKANRLLGPGSPSNPRLTCYGGDLMFNGEGLKEVASSVEKDYAPSIMSTTSEPQSVQRGPSSSPPLTPQDWLEAAKRGPRSRKEGTQRASDDQLPNTEPTFDPDLLPPTPERISSRAAFLARADSKPSAEEPQLPRNSSLRLRGWGSSAPTNADSQPRRRISLRPPFFSRATSNSKALQQSPMSDPVERDDRDDGAPSPVIRKTRRLSITKRPKLNLASEPSSAGITTRVEEASRELSNKILARPFNDSNRPSTSHSMDYKRRGSFGIFGWMKGSKDSQPSSPVTPGPSTKGRDRASSLLSSGRPSSALATATVAAANAMNNDTITPAKAKRFSAGEEDLERRARYLERRARRMVG